MDSDAVASIGDTVESEQVALVAQEVYYDLATHQRIVSFEKTIQLEAQSDLDRPTVFKLPSNVTDIHQIKYKKVDTNSGKFFFEEVTYVHRDDFITNQFLLDDTETNVDQMIFEDNIQIPYRNDKDPDCWTTVDHDYIIMDSINKDYDTTLQNDKVLAFAYQIPDFEFKDEFIAPLPAKMFPTYLAEIKYTVSPEMRQVQNNIQGNKAQRGRRRNNMMGSIADGLDTQSAGMRSTRHGKGRSTRGRYGR